MKSIFWFVFVAISIFLTSCSQDLSTPSVDLGSSQVEQNQPFVAQRSVWYEHTKSTGI